jgi:hypothetical protein
VTKTAHNALRNYTVHKTAKADTVNIQYRRERLDILDGTDAHEAIGRVLPNKGGTMIPYTFTDLKYDLRTEVLVLRSVDTTDPDDEDALDAAAMAATAFTAADERVEVRVQPTTYAEVTSANKASATVVMAVRRGRVIVRWCPTDENWSDIFTRPLASPKFTYFWHCMCGYIKWKLPDATDHHAATGATMIGNTVQIDFDYWVKDVP